MKKRIIVFDIDDTLLKANPNTLKVYKKVGDVEIGLTTEEFAKDPDAKVNNGMFDYRDFRDKDKVYKSIVESTPLIDNLQIMDKYIGMGYEFCFLTARCCCETIKVALDKFLLFRNKEGNLRKLGKKYNKKMCNAVNDIERYYEGKTDAEKKGNVLRKICQIYDDVVFVDDDIKNINYAKHLNLKNLKVIVAK